MLSAPLIWPRAMSGTQIRASGSSGVPGTVRTRGSRCAWLQSTASRCSCRPAGDALREADRRAHDLVGVHVADEHRLQHALRLVGLVDRQRVERDQVADRVGDANEERVEALLGENLVEDVGEAPVRLDEGRIACRSIGVEQPQMAGPDYHRSPDRSQFRYTV